MREPYRRQKTNQMDDGGTGSASLHRDNEIRLLLPVPTNQSLEVYLLSRHHCSFPLQSEEVRLHPYPGIHLGSPPREALLQMYSELELQVLAPSRDAIFWVAAPSIPPLYSSDSDYVQHICYFRDLLCFT